MIILVQIKKNKIKFWIKIIKIIITINKVK